MRRTALAALTAVAFAAIPSAAAAETMTIGSLAPAGTSSMCSSCSLFQFSTDPASPSYVVPSGNWTLVSWRTQAGTTTAGNVQVQVWRATGTAGQFRMIGSDPFQTISPNTAPSIPASIPVQGGDLLGRASGSPSGDIATTYPTSFASDQRASILSSNAMMVGDTAGPSVPASTYMLGAPTGAYRLNISATLSRPDTPPPVVPTKRKCKKKKKHASVAKKKKCKKKRKK